jgi:hypothetical protein
MTKRKVKKYGWLPPKEAETVPWDKMCIYLIGPYSLRRKGQTDFNKVNQWIGDPPMPITN